MLVDGIPEGRDNGATPGYRVSEPPHHPARRRVPRGWIGKTTVPGDQLRIDEG